MALRVLLADESSTIKKVFQLALQDYAVDVRPVNVGIDVLPVARAFKPDIIFADVLLQKQSGYDTSLQLKQDPTLGELPVVLMWSGFMELDEDKFNASRADAKLEKPFDVNQLRSLVNQLVPKTQGNRLSQYLSFPNMPEFKDEKPAAQPADDFAENENSAVTLLKDDFEQVPLPKMKGKDKFRVDIAPTDDENDLPVSYKMPVDKIEVDSLLGKEEVEEFSVRTAKRPPPPPPEAAVDLMAEVTHTHVPVKPPPPPMPTPAPHTPMQGEVPQMSATELEKIIRNQSREVIESVVWKVVPELAAQIIERELKRLLNERGEVSRGID